MNKLYTTKFLDEGPGFLSNFGQITRCVAIHGTHNEEAIDRNTDAVKAQTEMQHSESDESQIQFSGHSMMLERESNETQNIMTAHTKMMKDESDETQNIMTAHTQAMKDEGVANRQELNNQGTAIKNAITAQTSAINSQTGAITAQTNAISAQTGTISEKTDVLNNKIQNIIEKLESISGKIDNEGIEDAIRDLRLVVNFPEAPNADMMDADVVNVK